MTNLGYFVYRYYDKSELVEWLKVTNHNGAITWQWSLSWNDATNFDTLKKAKDYSKEYYKIFGKNVRGIAYLAPV